MIFSQEIFLILLFGALLICSISIKVIFQKMRMPGLIGFILLGWLMRFLDSQLSFLPQNFSKILGFFGDIGIIFILFRIGLESHINKLVQQLKRASFIVLFEVVLTCASIFCLGFYLFSLSLTESFFVAVAMTATSVGICIKLWEERKLQNTQEGNLLVDLSALDDLLSIALMALLYDLAPILHGGKYQNLITTLLNTLGLFLLKFSIFVFLCYIFAHFFENKMVRFLRKIEEKPDPTITIICISLIVAGLAGALGFSFALGAFFAGLTFSKVPQKIKVETSFLPLEDFFAPFFFISIGYRVLFTSLSHAYLFVAVLLLIAVLTKIIGVFVPAYLSRLTWKASALLGISMVPRAEVTMVVMEQGFNLGRWAVSETIYTSVVLSVLFLAIFIPMFLRPLLHRSIVSHMQRKRHN